MGKSKKKQKQKSAEEPVKLKPVSELKVLPPQFRSLGVFGHAICQAACPEATDISTRSIAEAYERRQMLDWPTWSHKNSCSLCKRSLCRCPLFRLCGSHSICLKFDDESVDSCHLQLAYSVGIVTPGEVLDRAKRLDVVGKLARTFPMIPDAPPKPCPLCVIKQSPNVTALEAKGVMSTRRYVGLDPEKTWWSEPMIVKVEPEPVPEAEAQCAPLPLGGLLEARNAEGPGATSRGAVRHAQEIEDDSDDSSEESDQESEAEKAEKETSSHGLSEVDEVRPVGVRTVEDPQDVVDSDPQQDPESSSPKRQKKDADASKECETEKKRRERVEIQNEARLKRQKKTVVRDKVPPRVQPGRRVKIGGGAFPTRSATKVAARSLAEATRNTTDT